MTFPFAITLFLPDGHSDGIKIIEKSNWNGCGLICPRVSLFPKHRGRSEFNKPGVYMLVGGDELGRRVYIGEGDPLLPRLEAHYREKEWWSEVIIFTSKDQNLNKAFIQFLEARLVQESHRSNRFIIENGNKPSEPTLSETDKAVCEGFLREIKLCLPIFGINLFDDTSSLKSITNPLLFIKAKGISATGFETTDGFIVEAGSYATYKTTPTIPTSIQNLRQTLISQGKLTRRKSELFIFNENTLFGSPSTASSVILGCSSNGREAWKNEKGTPLKTIQLQRLEQ